MSNAIFMSSGDRLAALSDLLRTRFGLAIERYSERLVAGVLDRCLRTRGALTKDTIDSLVLSFSIGETTFLRHLEHFQCLARLLPHFSESPLRIWSAGCATGEEAWSLAAVCRQVVGARPYSVLGTDLNARFLEHARRGQYRRWSLRGVAPECIRGWLRVSGFDIEVEAALRPNVSFQALNLIGGRFPVGMHIVFCRNVLLYFDAEAAASVLRRLASSLVPGGYLFLGYTDPRPPEDSELVPVEIDGTLAYRKPASFAARISEDAAHVTECFAADRTVASEQAVADVRPGIDAVMEVARGLSMQHLVDEALGILQEAVTESPLEAEACVLGALIATEHGRWSDGARFARRACFLVPEAPLPHYLLAWCLCEEGELHLARHRFTDAYELVAAGNDVEAVRFGEGVTVGQLKRLIEIRREACLS